MDNRLRVLTVMDSLGVGGTETHALSLIQALRERGVSPSYAGASGALYGEFARAGCPILPVDLTAGALMNPGAGDASIRALKRIAQRRRIDVVHVHQTPSGLYAAIAAGELGIPTVFTVHGTYYGNEALTHMAMYCQRFVSVSESIQSHLASLGIPSTFIPNGIDLTEFRPVSPLPVRRSLGIPETSRVVVYASRLAWDKAIVCSQLMLAAQALRAAEIPDLHLVVVGDGNQSLQLRLLADRIHKETGQPFIHMTGARTNIRDYYAAGDAVVGTGRVAMEAMACGKPVLAVGNHGYIGTVDAASFAAARDSNFGDHGSLRKPTKELIGQALGELLGEPGTLRRVSAESYALARQSFDIRTVAARTREVYEAALAAPLRPTRGES